MTAKARMLLLTGATGFVGGAVRPALVSSGWRVRCLTRDATRARARAPDLEWVQGDVHDPVSCARAMEGCQAALYLVHGIGEGGDYRAREIEAMAEDAYRSGQTGLVALLQTIGTAREIRTRAIEADRAYQLAVADLERAVGVPLQ